MSRGRVTGRAGRGAAGHLQGNIITAWLTMREREREREREIERYCRGQMDGRYREGKVTKPSTT